MEYKMIVMMVGVGFDTSFANMTILQEVSTLRMEKSRREATKPNL
jgi:hypothetical protein